jgi:hypothetical protein
MRADLLVLRADPEADIRNTRAIDRLFQGGVERRPADLLSGEPQRGPERGSGFKYCLKQLVLERVAAPYRLPTTRKPKRAKTARAESDWRWATNADDEALVEAATRATGYTMAGPSARGTS